MNSKDLDGARKHEDKSIELMEDALGYNQQLRRCREELCRRIAKCLLTGAGRTLKLPVDNSRFHVGLQVWCGPMDDCKEALGLEFPVKVATGHCLVFERHVCVLPHGSGSGWVSQP